eukprot:15456896-Alexandrium_andersonii.AAC.1
MQALSTQGACRLSGSEALPLAFYRWPSCLRTTVGGRRPGDWVTALRTFCWPMPRAAAGLSPSCRID